MRNFKILLFVFIIILVFIGISCEKVINIDIEDAKIKIVLNGVINTDSAVIVHLTRSRHILDNASISPLTDATVKLFEDNNEIGVLSHIGNGFYKINFIPRKGHEYKITAEHSAYDDIYATTKINNPVPIISIDTFTSYGQYESKILNFNLKFTDPADESNYYMLTLVNSYLSKEWSDTVQNIDTLYVGPDTTIVSITYGGYTLIPMKQYVYSTTEDIIVETQLYNGRGFVFSDELINGKTYNLKFNADYYSFFGDTNKVYIQLKSISKELFLYFRSLQAHFNNQGDPFAEPVMVYTNVTNGLGIFGSQSIYSDSLIFINTNNYWYFEKKKTK